MPKPRRNEPRNADLLEWCESEFRRYLHVPDPGFLYVVMGTIVANCFKGRPIWLMLVGSSGCGKTEVLMSASSTKPEWFRVLSGANKAAFLSGTGKRDKATDATGGVLREIIDKEIRFLIFKEYGSVLDMRKDDYNEFTSMMREIWDGHVNRPVGTDGGKMLDWSGKIGNLAACTNRVDEVLAEEVSRGVRWLLWRYPQSNGWQETSMAMETLDPQEMREALSTAMATVIEAAGIEWGMESRKLTNRESLRIMRLAVLSSKLQGAVKRNQYRVWEVTNAPDETLATRLGPALSRIYLGMELIGVEASERWKQIRKIAFDTAPALRVNVLREYVRRVRDGGKLDDWNAMADSVRCGGAVFKREMEDLALLGVIQRDRRDGGVVYTIPAETEEEL